MIIVEERPLPTAPAVRVTPAGEHPAGPPANTDRPDPAARADRPEPSGAAPAEDTSLALAMASIRISRGNPTAEEIAALAVLLTTRLRKRHETLQPAPSAARPRRLPPLPCPPFRAPGAWGS
ncbi:acyl-CoA carboxylase epsilon subunit [Streptomyces sp. LARHCF249]